MGFKFRVARKVIHFGFPQNLGFPNKRNFLQVCEFKGQQYFMVLINFDKCLGSLRIKIKLDTKIFD